MSRKQRTSDQETQSTSTTETATPENGTAVAEPSAPANDNMPAANDNQPGFAERVGQRKARPVPDPFGIATDYLAGVRLFESKRDRQMAIKFGEGRPEDKPSQEVIDKLKEAGWRWNPSDRIWAHPVSGESSLSTRIEAEKLYQELRQMIRQEKGIGTGPEVPF